MPQILKLTEGWTGPLPFTLKADGTAINLTGITVDLILKDRNGVTINTTADVVATTPQDGLVTYTPDAADLTAALSPYSIKFKLTDAGGAIVYVPNGEADTIMVYGA